MRRATLPLLLLVVLPACASTAPSATGGRPATTTMGSAEVGRLTIANNSSEASTSLPYSADAVFRILPSVFDSLAIPVNSMDPATRAIGNTAMKVRSRLGKVYLSRYLDCGNTQIGPNADNYDVVLTVMARVATATPTTSTMTVSVEAQARPATYNQAYSSCSSKGGLEARLAELAKARLAK